jgi:hypothetical protein
LLTLDDRIVETPKELALATAFSFRYERQLLGSLSKLVCDFCGHRIGSWQRMTKKNPKIGQSPVRSCAKIIAMNLTKGKGNMNEVGRLGL